MALSDDDIRLIERLIEERVEDYVNPLNLPSDFLRSHHIRKLTLGGVDDTGGIIYIKDEDGNTIVTINKDGIVISDTSSSDIVTIDSDGIAVTDTADITVGGDSINTNAEIFSHLSVEHFWTDSSSYEDRTGSFFSLNSANFTNQSVYFECVMGNEQASRTAYTRIYNITDGAVLSGSELTSTANPLSAVERVRSSALTLTTGTKEYKLQIRMNQAGGAGDNAHFYAARLVITQA